MLIIIPDFLTPNIKKYFNQLIGTHLKDFILDDIQPINFLPSRLRQ